MGLTPGTKCSHKEFEELKKGWDQKSHERDQEEIETLKKKLQKKSKGLPNPNPTNFKIVELVKIGRYLITKVNYPDCKNYEGNKILVFENVTEKKLRSLTFLDPHFCDGDHISPIARFTPTDDGWEYACSFALTNK